VNNDNTSANYGIVMSIRGSVVEAQFDNKLPAIYSVLHAGEEDAIVMEVLAQIGKHRVFIRDCWSDPLT
jgi:F-type H+-transporting ATPase subunit beta